MEELLRFLFITIAILYIIRAIVRFLLPMLFQNLVNKAQQQQQNHQRNYNSTDQSNDKVTVDYVPDGKKGKFPDNEGEFVDYEEVK